MENELVETALRNSFLIGMFVGILIGGIVTMTIFSHLKIQK